MRQTEVNQQKTFQGRQARHILWRFNCLVLFCSLLVDIANLNVMNYEPYDLLNYRNYQA